MTEQYKPNIGEVPVEDARRDAIHIAVVPLMAGENLKPGQTFDLCDRGRAVISGTHDYVDSVRVGIVDPFRTDMIKSGSRFWGFLFPNTITNLRHIWTHPAFKAKLSKE